MNSVTRNARAPARTAKPGFFEAMGLAALAIAFIGFAKTFIAPLASGTFHAPAVVHIHGAFAFAWVLIFATQPLFIRTGNFPFHRMLGFTALAAAIGFAATAPFVGAYAAARDFANGGGETAISGIVGTFTSALIFLSLVFAGFLNRKHPEIHKRLMLLATIVVLWPAWFRFRHYFPDVPKPEIVFGVVLADSLILIAAARDWLVERRIHPVWLFCGGALVFEHVFEVLAFDSGPWRAAAHFLFGLVHG
ncbi:MAG: hypothetical protein KJS97_13450 [Alphaproteobacteria bacterium]|nr:hypothetical protein [Alphaproteobacteria bacterium]